MRVAERRLAAATARVGVAVGDLFPKVTHRRRSRATWHPPSAISGKAKRDSFLWARASPGRPLIWVACGRESVRAKAQTDAALAAYEGAVLSALEDTEGALISYGRAQSRRESLQVAAAASDKAADLARKRFEGGLIDFLEVLDAERTALSAELLLSQSRTDAATSLVAVYKALGAAGSCLRKPDRSLPRRRIARSARYSASELHHDTRAQDDFARAKIRIPITRTAIAGVGVGATSDTARR